MSQISDFKVLSPTMITATILPTNTDPTEAASVTVGDGFIYAGPIQPANASSGYSPWTNLWGMTASAQILAPAQIMWNGKPISGADPSTQSAVVGQQIYLATATPGLPDSLSITKGTWTVGGTNIGKYSIVRPVPGSTVSSATVTPTTLTNNPGEDPLTTLTTYWLYPKDNVSVTYQYCAIITGLSKPDADAGANCSLDATAKFNVTGPSAEVTPSTLGWWVSYKYASCPSSPQLLVYGTVFPCSTSTFVPGIRFTPINVSNDSGGTFQWVQVISGNIASCTIPNGRCTSQPLGTGLDLSYPYPFGNENEAEDTPTLGLDNTVNTESRAFKATMYLEWIPNGEPDLVIPVPIAQVVWNIKGTATQSANYWRFSSAADLAPVSQPSTDDGPFHGLPTWNAVVLKRVPQKGGQ